MAVELPPGYQPPADEELMNPEQVEYFRQRLEEARTDLRRGRDAMPPRDATPAQPQSENLRSKTANGSRG
jgi:hypothetical protein